MPHSAVNLARSVLDHQNDYTVCIITQAIEIIKWSETKRALVQRLWSEYRKPYTEFVIEQRKRRGQPRMMVHSALNDVLARYMPRVAINDFHRCKNAIRHEINMAMLFETFKAGAEASRSPLVFEMHRYLKCVNAQLHDDSLGDVGFLRMVPKLHLAEILLFRLTRAHEVS